MVPVGGDDVQGQGCQVPLRQDGAAEVRGDVPAGGKVDAVTAHLDDNFTTTLAQGSKS